MMGQKKIEQFSLEASILQSSCQVTQGKVKLTAGQEISGTTCQSLGYAFSTTKMDKNTSHLNGLNKYMDFLKTTDLILIS